MTQPSGLNIDIQFGDVIQLWEHALTQKGGTIQLPEEKQAIHIMHRLNTVRKKMRERDGICAYDLYIVRQKGKTLTILPRPQVNLESFQPLEPEDLEL